ncbi:ferredoxin [Nocardia amikacinitolerans]|uniref:ferredoxin n=1 Tax=Nocardia amikacinitolerans TaxID=756689 RepID=UPI0020A3BAAB|nr:ferredoxin [Nocardia amikacinitolerans]MCP2275823.1 Ferredoxin [Nocardia amikacinitolerans]
MKISVDLDLCQGHAVCQSEAPTVFAVPKRGQVEILEPRPDPELREAVAGAIRYCPTRALSLADDGETDDAAKGAH